MAQATEVQAAQAIITRFLSQHGKGSCTFRPFFKRGIYRRENYRYLADLSHLLPDAELGSFSCIWGTYAAEQAMSLRFALNPFGPVKIYVNGKLSGSSDIFSERYRSKQIFDLELQQGTNDLVLACECTSGGFGCEFGTWVGKLDYYFLMPSPMQESEGVWYSHPLDAVPEHLDETSLRSLDWYPEPFVREGNEVDLAQIFPLAPEGSYVVMTTSLTLEQSTWCTIGSNAELLVDGVQIMQESVELAAGTHQLTLYAKTGKPVLLSIQDARTNEVVKLYNPVLGTETAHSFLLAGPFDEHPREFVIQYLKPFVTSTGALDFWHLEGEAAYLRIYNENLLFGHWNYPLGVTLYGLVESERMLKELDEELSHTIHHYLVQHIQTSIDTYAYGMWDKQTLGGATAVHHLMTSLDSLDDCGSFASTLLEVAKDHELNGYEPLMEVVGHYISKEQPRLSDGTFFRTALMHEFHENTMWVDDLYMSVPFLCRYAHYSGDASHLDDAAHQFFGFAKYLYMEEEQLMSHVYDFDRNLATGIPWGRGNGWVLFSLSELLMVLDDTHPKRPALLDLFCKLSEGYLRLQDEQGMFHQVLNYPQSYQESSCTAMFACAFSRGVRFGWYDEPEPYRLGCINACDGLKEMAIDADGHVWGVCRGSEFSCSKHYYAEQLLPRLDDTHGIGIILLALCERAKLS